MVFSAIAPEFIMLLATEEYYDAIKLVPVISLSSYFGFLYTVFSTVEFFFERNKLIAIASVTGAATNVILNLLLIPLFGYYAAGYTTLVSYVLYSLVHFVFMKRVCKKELASANVYDNRTIFFISLAVTAVVFLLLLIYDYIWLRYVALILPSLVAVVNRRKISEKLSAIKGDKG